MQWNPGLWLQEFSSEFLPVLWHLALAKDSLILETCLIKILSFSSQISHVTNGAAGQIKKIQALRFFGDRISFPFISRGVRDTVREARCSMGPFHLRSHLSTQDRNLLSGRLTTFSVWERFRICGWQRLGSTTRVAQHAFTLKSNSGCEFVLYCAHVETDRVKAAFQTDCHPFCFEWSIEVGVRKPRHFRGCQQLRWMAHQCGSPREFKTEQGPYCGAAIRETCGCLRCKILQVDIIYIHIYSIYIYTWRPLWYTKTCTTFFLYHFENYVRFKGCKKKVHVYFGPPSFFCPKGASRLKPP